MQAHLITLTKYLGFCLILFGCGGLPESTEIDDSEYMHVSSNLLELRTAEGKTYFKGKLFTGFRITAHSRDQFESKERYVDGIKDGYSRKWFKDGTLSYEALFNNGKLHGPAKSWWINGNIRTESSYVEGIAQGIQLQWYKSGNIFKRIQLLDGVEEGIQQSYRENGKLYNNYEAKNGRIFGLKRSKLCFQLDDETIK